MNATGDDFTGKDLVAHLPNSTSAFEATYVDGIDDYIDFYNHVFEARNDKPLYPYRYGAYQVYQASKADQRYAITAFLNITSQDVAALFPQYIYQSVLANANDDPDFKFDVTTEPFPVFYVFKQREQAANSFDFAFMVSIGLALIPCVMVSYILKEREEQLKHI